MIDARAIAAALGGQVTGTNTILCPGPGHSSRDRSLAVRLDPAAPDGFLTYSHAGDPWRACRDHIRERLALPPWGQKSSNAAAFLSGTSRNGILPPLKRR